MKGILMYPLLTLIALPFVAIGFAIAFIKECLTFGGELQNDFSKWCDK